MKPDIKIYAINDPQTVQVYFMYCLLKWHTHSCQIKNQDLHFVNK